MVQLKYIDEAIHRRREIEAYYRSAIANIPGIKLLPPLSNTVGNASYFPILVTNEYPLTRDELYFKMKEAGIHGRRYFYPLISDMPMYRGMGGVNLGSLQEASNIAEQVICLPIHPNINEDSTGKVLTVIQEL